MIAYMQRLLHWLTGLVGLFASKAAAQLVARQAYKQIKPAAPHMPGTSCHSCSTHHHPASDQPAGTTLPSIILSSVAGIQSDVLSDKAILPAKSTQNMTLFIFHVTVRTHALC